MSSVLLSWYTIFHRLDLFGRSGSFQSTVLKCILQRNFFAIRCPMYGSSISMGSGFNSISYSGLTISVRLPLSSEKGFLNSNGPVVGSSSSSPRLDWKYNCLGHSPASVFSLRLFSPSLSRRNPDQLSTFLVLSRRTLKVRACPMDQANPMNLPCNLEDFSLPTCPLYCVLSCLET